MSSYINNENPISTKSKNKALDFIFENTFRAGFGTLNKAELDAILFAAIIKYSNQEHTSDLYLSKYLQITQRRVRSLKETVSVKYLQITAKDAIQIFVDKITYAKKDGKYIDIPIKDVAVKNEIEGLLDEHNLLLHSQLNSKIFRIRIDDLFDLLIIFESVMDSNVSVEDMKNVFIEKIKSNEKAIRT